MNIKVFTFLLDITTATLQNPDKVKTVTNRLVPPRTYIALGFITVSTNSNCAPLHKSHQPLKVPLVDNTSVVLKGLWIVCVKLLQCVKTQDK